MQYGEEKRERKERRMEREREILTVIRGIDWVS